MTKDITNNLEMQCTANFEKTFFLLGVGQFKSTITTPKFSERVNYFKGRCHQRKPWFPR